MKEAVYDDSDMNDLIVLPVVVVSGLRAVMAEIVPTSFKRKMVQPRRHCSLFPSNWSDRKPAQG
jgi:hypothetical protein